MENFISGIGYALEIPYSEDSDAFYESPEPNLLTDKYSGDEDSGGIIDLSDPQLWALAEVKFVSKNNVKEDTVQIEKSTKISKKSKKIYKILRI